MNWQLMVDEYKVISEKNIYSILRNSVDVMSCLTSIVMLVLNLYLIHFLWLGVLFFILYLVIVSRAISRKLTFFDKYLVFPFSFLFLNLLFAIMSAVVIGLSIPLSNELLVIFLLIPTLFFIKKGEKIDAQEKTNEPAEVIRKNCSINPIVLLVFSLSLFGMLVSLWFARTGSTIPYFQMNLSPVFYFFAFIASASAVLAILSRGSLRLKLIIIVAYSLVFSTFRYIIYVVIWGSDAWDNLLTAWWIHDGGVLQLSSNLYNFLARGSNAYLSLWGINVSFSRITGVDLFSLSPYIGLLLAFFVPLIMYQIVKTLTKNKTAALIISLMSFFVWDTFFWLSIPYANCLGFLALLFSLLFWILYLNSEKISIYLPILMTVVGVLAYPLTGIYVVLIALLAISIRLRGLGKNVVIISALSCLVLPLYDLVVQIGYFLTTGVRFTLPSFLSVEGILTNLVFFSPRKIVEGYYLNNLLDIPYFIIYALAAIGIILGRRQVKREIYYLLLAVFISVFVGEAYGWWVQERILHHVGATILPWFLLIFASMSFKGVHTRILKILPTFRVSMSSLRRLRKNYLVQPRKLLAISICLIFGIAAASNFIFSPTTNSQNASTDLVNAVNYVISQNPSKDHLILTDVYTIKLLRAFSHGPWYGYPYGDRLDELELTVPTYDQVINNPSTVQSAVIEGKTIVTSALEKLNVTCDFKEFYIIFNAGLADLSKNISSPIVETLSSIIGAPEVFGSVYVYSGYIAEKTEHGYISRLNNSTLMYDLSFTDFASLLSSFNVEGNVTYFNDYSGLLVFKDNSSLTMKIDTEYSIINATLSCSIYQYEDFNDNSIQVSVDGVNWLTVLKVNSTMVYVDLSNIELPLAPHLHSSFYLKFFSQNVSGDASAYSMDIRNFWGNNAQYGIKGIKLTIFTVG